MLRAGRLMSGLPALFLLLEGVMRLVKPEPVVKATVQLGYPESVILGFGIVLLECVILYLIPRTSVLGAILLTGYLGAPVRQTWGAYSPKRLPPWSDRANEVTSDRRLKEGYAQGPRFTRAQRRCVVYPSFCWTIPEDGASAKKASCYA
jgi:hypothetical protein